MQVKAQIARPDFAEAVRAGRTYQVRGAAWTSEAEITKVEISTNGGETWHNTHLLGEPIRNAWRLWEYDWKVPTRPGKATLVARATDSEGRTQPTERDQDRRSYIVKRSKPTATTRWPSSRRRECPKNNGSNRRELPFSAIDALRRYFSNHPK